MKRFVCAVIVVALTSSALFAGENGVSQETLSAMGLGELQPMTDAEGMNVRGQSSSFALVMGTGVIVGQLLTPDTKNFIIGSDANMVQGNAETTDALGISLAFKDHHSTVELYLNELSAYGTVGGTGIAAGGGLNLSYLLPSF